MPWAVLAAVYSGAVGSAAVSSAAVYAVQWFSVQCTVHQMRGSEGQFCFTNALPIYATILETLGCKEVKYVNLNQNGPPGAPLGPLKPP